MISPKRFTTALQGFVGGVGARVLLQGGEQGLGGGKAVVLLSSEHGVGLGVGEAWILGGESWIRGVGAGLGHVGARRGPAGTGLN